MNAARETDRSAGAPGGDDAALKEVLSMLRSLGGDMRNQASAISAIEKAHGDALADIKFKLNTLMAAFPDQDLRAHADYHRSQRNSSAFWEEVRKDLVKNTAKLGVWAIIVSILSIAGMGFLSWIKKSLLL